MNLKLNLRALRESRGLSITDVAIETRLSARAIIDIETRIRPTPIQFKELLKLYQWTDGDRLYDCLMRFAYKPLKRSA